MNKYPPAKCPRCGESMLINAIFKKDKLHRLIPDGKVRFQWKCPACNKIKHTHRDTKETYNKKRSVYLREYRSGLRGKGKV